MDTGNENQKSSTDRDTIYRQEDLAAFETLDKIDRKLKVFKVMTPIIGALLIVVGVWGLTNSSGGNEKTDPAKVNALNQQLDSMKQVSKSLRSEKQNLKGKLNQKNKLIDSLQENRQAKVSENEDADKMKGGKEKAEARTYQVDTNDNLWKIAKKFYDDGHQADKIIEANNLDNPDSLRVDQKLKIPK